MRANTYHLIANAHLDLVWLWRWEEGCTEGLSTFATACDLLDEYEELIFCHNEAVLYDWVERLAPPLFERIRAHVAAGRWHIMGGWWLQPDVNLPMGESTIRNILLGRRYFGERFGVRPRTAVNFDSFGHARGLVQILKRADFDSYLVYRPGPQHYPFVDHDFIWEGLDGSEIVVHRSDEGYNSVWGLAADKLAAFMGEGGEPRHRAHPEVAPSPQPVSLFLWGVGDHGGGPTREDLEGLRALLAEQPEGRLVHSWPERYFEALAKAEGPALPRVARGLNPVAPGCYTSQIRVKQGHRRLELELYAAERMAAVAALRYGRPYPAALFDEVMEDLAFVEFHDALPGTATQEVEEDTLRVLAHSLERLSRERLSSLIALSSEAPRATPGRSTLMIFNPHPYALDEVIACEVGLPRQNWDGDFMYPQASVDGVDIPTQAEKESSNFSLDWRKRAVMQLHLEPMALTRVELRFSPIPARPVYEPIMAEADYVFETESLRVVIDLSTGLIASYCVDGIDYFAAAAGRLELRDDTSNPWSIHSRFSHVRRTFSLASPAQTTAFAGLDAELIDPIRVIEDGPVRTVVEAIFALEDSRICVRYLLPKRGRHVDVELLVDNRHKQQSLKWLLPLGEEGELWGQILAGRERLNEDGAEAVHQQWLLYRRPDGHALALFNDGIYGVNCEEGVVGLTLLRSAGYTASDFVMGRALQERQWAPRMEQGQRRYRFRLLGGEREALEPGLDRLALSFNDPPYVQPYNPISPAYGGLEGSHRGRADEPFMRLSPDSVVLWALKRSARHAEGEVGKTPVREEAYTLRLFESSGRAQTARLEIPSLGIDAAIELGGFEIATLRIEPEDGNVLRETLLEGH